jgi:hypothetical protein
VSAAQNSLSSTNALPPAVAPVPADFVTGRLNLDFSNYHLTPRGINLQNKGLVFQPLLRLDWTLYQAKHSTNRILDKVTFTTAVWNDVDTSRSGVDPGNWNEVDFITGPNAKFLKDWTLESPFIAFKSETGSFAICWAWNPRLSYHDHCLGNFSLNPYAEFFYELQNKITVVLVPSESKGSYYGVIGVDPTYVFSAFPLKLELPSYVTITGNDFYQRTDGSGGGTDIGLAATMFKATIPLAFVTPCYGGWSLYAGVQYDRLNNPGLLDGNEIAGAAHSRERNLLVFHGGITVLF